jgi:hypothetical protein
MKTTRTMSATDERARRIPGTRIETHGFPAAGRFPAVPPERGVILQWRENMNGQQPTGWHVVRFDLGGELCMHETRFRVIGEAE